MRMKKLSIDSDLTPPIEEEDHVIGPETATVTLVAYCDFECPYCGRAYPIIKLLQARLRNRLRFVFRHFPLTAKHAYAQLAAEAAEAAGSQGEFWAMHDVLFENQDALEDGDLYAYAGVLGLDAGRFERELSSRFYAKRVDRDVRSGRRSGVSGTPTFFMNGFRHTDEETMEQLVLRMSERRPV
ncbi:MAG: Periplasmic thiol:disulfide interchange protein DsbA [Nitrospira sp.]|jgi:protein-disulfide isomerase|nr:Periplasmic thiol:disulfide interchange protein DsbA [Nitrospira sp.]